MVKPPSPPPRQPRSLATERRLIDAVIGLLHDGGLAACTAPAVAERAGVAVGTIYRRYPDKDALVAAAILDVVSLRGGEREAQYEAFAREAQNLADFIRRVAAAAVVTAREHRAFLLAIKAFARSATDPAWRASFEAEVGRARSVIARSALDRFGAEIRGGEPALRMALAAVYGAVETTWLEPVAGLFPETPSPDAFVEALVDMQAAYLGRR
jgi:AcrR family transcriptional regulator